IIETANGLVGSFASLNWSKASHDVRDWVTGQEDMRCGLTADANVGRPAAAGLSLHIETRPPATDQFQLSEERCKLAGGILPGDLLGLGQDSPGLGIAAFGTEVAEQARPQALRFAEIDDLAALIDHPVDARPARTLLAHKSPQLSRTPRGDAN